MGAICSVIRRLCCRGSAGRGGSPPSPKHYKKLDEAPPDLEAGAASDDEFEAWDESADQQQRAPPRPAQKTGMLGLDTGAGAAEPAAEPEPDPFAGFEMAPTIKRTQRHAAESAWDKPAPVASGRLALSADADAEGAGGGGGGWGGDDDEELLGLGGTEERRKAAEARRAQRRREREASSKGAPRPQRIAATKVYEDSPM